MTLNMCGQTFNIIMNSTANKFIKGIHTEYTGKRVRALADLEVYLNQPVGVGEHSKLSDEIESILKRVHDCEDIIETIEKHFNFDEKEKEVINE